MRRWHKNAKSLDKYADITEVGSERDFLLHHGELHAAAQWMLYVGARSPSLFSHVLNGIHTLLPELDSGHEHVHQKKEKDTVEIYDPDVVKTKGAPHVLRQVRKKRRCTHCKKTRHTKRHYNADRAVISKVEDNKAFEATNLGSEGSSPTKKVKTPLLISYCGKYIHVFQTL
ncbi:uncharacterized protein LOC107612296 isoform X2 [Arachis ipaensis]|uniref:uncharacterized protein LOC107612296 isoform X2 n=1 Tax=Arachis ipaensis TaxID=130454 RepID=UPI0007AFD33F|nr:uncharacterized protein LOC107612296 isoform X2 [Arachis ipaensis]XP_025674039.1 uncharacterized protein LOC112773192 isoform X2 [Arachis hypogaea]